MEDYKEFTFGWLIFVFTVPIHLLLTYFYIKEDRSIGATAYVIITLTFMVIYLFF